MNKYVMHTTTQWNVVFKSPKTLTQVLQDISSLKEEVGWFAHYTVDLPEGGQMGFFVDQIVGVREV